MTCYGTVEDADAYFVELLRRELWFDATAADKLKALNSATILIDRLNFKLEKAESDQELQFPRTDQDEVPLDIQYATYELAYVLLNDVDPDAEIRGERRISHTMGSVKTVLDSSFIQTHVHSAIPSAQAWHYLFPYIDQSGRDLRLERVS